MKRLFILLLVVNSIMLFAKPAYVEGENPLHDKYYDVNEKNCIEDGPRRYACYTAGEKYIYFKKEEMDKGVKYWEKSCKERAYGTACYFLAKVYLNKQNGKYFSKEKAIKALEYGCRMGEQNSIKLGCDQGVKICCQK